MTTEKKRWFIAYSYRVWLPVSWEGWLSMLLFTGLVVLIYVVNDVSDDVPFVFAKHWPMLAEFVVLIAALLWISRGHAEKRY